MWIPTRCIKWHSRRTHLTVSILFRLHQAEIVDKSEGNNIPLRNNLSKENFHFAKYSDLAMKHIYYHPRMRGGNNFTRVCLSVCMYVSIYLSVLTTGPTRLIRSHSSARFYFELSGNSNYKIHCNSNYVQNFELEINSI